MRAVVRRTQNLVCMLLRSSSLEHTHEPIEHTNEPITYNTKYSHRLFEQQLVLLLHFLFELALFTITCIHVFHTATSKLANNGKTLGQVLLPSSTIIKFTILRAVRVHVCLKQDLLRRLLSLKSWVDMRPDWSVD